MSSVAVGGPRSFTITPNDHGGVIVVVGCIPWDLSLAERLVMLEECEPPAELCSGLGQDHVRPVIIEASTGLFLCEARWAA